MKSADVFSILEENLLCDYDSKVIDLISSHGSTLVDVDGNSYLDLYSHFASQALGYNNEKLFKRMAAVHPSHYTHKVANSDIYSEVYASFVEEFFKNVSNHFKYGFFIDGGALGVENALKAAFDWKCKLCNISEDKLDVIHLKQAFHGRTGYTLSLTNTSPDKIDLFPKFKWTRIDNPKVQYPMSIKDIVELEKSSLDQAEVALKKGNVAAVILEPIQGEGGDNHFRAEYLQQLYHLTRRYESLLIFDEVQTGVGLTGKMWAHEHFGVQPDMMCFGKKTQVCGFVCSSDIDLVPNNVFYIHSRINSTWGGNYVDMIRAKHILQIIKEDNLVENARVMGNRLLQGLFTIAERYPKVSNVRGSGLMIAFDLPSCDERDSFIKSCSNEAILLSCGNKSVRLRPYLDIDPKSCDTALDIIEKHVIML